MMPTIRVDDDVYDWLQRRAKPFVDTPNSVLRRELKIGAVAAPAPLGRTGELSALVQAGLLHAGEELIWKRRGVTHHAVVTSEGTLELEDARIFESPSGAARALAGYESTVGATGPVFVTGFVLHRFVIRCSCWDGSRRPCSLRFK